MLYILECTGGIALMNCKISSYHYLNEKKTWIFLSETLKFHSLHSCCCTTFID